MNNSNDSSEISISISPYENTTLHDNETLSGEELDLGVPMTLMSSLTLMCLLVAWVLNIIVLCALRRVPENRLKMKYLLKNAIAGDMMLALSLGIRVLFELTGAVEGNNELASLCAIMVYDFYAYGTTFYQIFASMAVGIDRFASILKPLAYHTMKYTRLAKTAVIGTVFALSLGLSMPLIVLKLEPGVPFIEVCYRAFNPLWYAAEVLPAIVIVSVITTLILYCVIFFMIIYHRRKTRNTLAERTDKENDTKSEMSLAVTFFLIHITYVLMYLPGALFHSGVFWIESQPYLRYYLGQLTIVIYLGNTIVDPMIYIFRIRSIRDQVTFVCCQNRLKTKGIQKKRSINNRSVESKSLPSITGLTATSIVDPN